MARVSMGDVWDDTKAFVTRERALLVPGALATLGLGTLVTSLIMPVARTPEALIGNPALMPSFLPMLLLTMLGQVAMSLLALTPAISVGEALIGAARRLGGVALATVLTGLIFTVVLIVASIAAQLIGSVLGLGPMQAAKLAAIVGLPVLLWLLVRLMPLLPMLATLPPTLRVVPPMRRAFATTRGHAGAIAGAAVAFIVAYALIVTALQWAGGSLLILAGRAIGLPALGRTLDVVLVALAGAVLQMFWAVFQAMLYRRLERAR